MSDRRIKGTNLAQIATFIDQKYSHRDREKIYALLPSDLKATLKVVDPSEWYPVEYENTLERAMASVAANEEEAERNARELGRYLFDMALGTFMRLVLRVLTPPMFLKKTSDIWPRMFSFGSFEADASMMESGKAVMLMRGVEGCEWMPSVSAGFIEAAMVAMNYSDVTVNYEPMAGEPEGSYRFFVTWA